MAAKPDKPNLMITSERKRWLRSIPLLLLLIATISFTAYDALDTGIAGSQSGRITIGDLFYNSTATNSTSDRTQDATLQNTTGVESEPDQEINSRLNEEPFSADPVVAFYADNQSDTDEEDQNHQAVVSYILATDADPIFHAGDVMEDGTQDSLDRFNSVTTTLRSTRDFYAALGNNDRDIADPNTPSTLFLDNFVFPNNEQWYSVNYGNLHLVVLDSAFSSDDLTQRRWLSTDLLTDDAQERIIGVIFHHPSFSSSISEQLIDFGVDFVVAGHLHSYSHSISNGIDHFVLSGQPNIGYMIAQVYDNSVSFTVYDHNNSVIESVTVSDRPCTLDKCGNENRQELFNN